MLLSGRWILQPLFLLIYFVHIKQDRGGDPVMGFWLIWALMGASTDSVPRLTDDPKKCLRLLVSLSCATPGTVSFQGVISRDGILTDVVPLPPHDVEAYRRIAACIADNGLYYAPRFAGRSGVLVPGVHVYAVSPFNDACNL